MTQSTSIQINQALLLTRLVDAQACACFERGEIPFYLSVAGHEAAAVGGAAGLGAADWIFPGFHQLGAAIYRQVPLQRLVSRILGTAGDPGLGRELPGFHFSRAARIAPATPNLGAHLLQAYGAALAIKHRGAREVVLAFAGPASEATSAFAQAIGRAREQALPLVVLVEGSGGGRKAQDIANRVKQAAETARAGRGPKILQISQADNAFDGVQDDPALAARVEAAFEAARSSGPPPVGEVFSHVSELQNPVLEQQARWFARTEASDG